VSPQLEPESTQAVRRKARRRAKDEPQPVSQVTTSRTYTSLGTAERESGGTLPTGIVSSLANMGLSERRIRRAAKLVARDLDVTPRYLFGKTDLSGYEEPVHGGRLKASTLRRITDDLAPTALASMLRNVSAGTTSAVQRREAGGVVPVDPVAVAAHMRTLTRLIRDELDASTAITVAAQLQRSGANPKAFEQNLLHVTEWVRQTAQDIDWQGAVTIALKATQAKRKFASNLDVVKYLLPPEARAQVARGEQGPAGNVSPRLGTVTPEGELAKGSLMQARLMAVTPNEDFFAEAKKLEHQIVLDKTAFQRSWLGKALVPVTKVLNWPVEKLQEGIIEASGGVILAQHALGAAVTDRDMEDAWRGYQGFRHRYHENLNDGTWLGSQVAKEAGAPGWVGVGADFALGWWLDPFVLGGKALRGLRQVRVAPGLLRPTVKLTDAARKILPGGGRRLEARIARQNAVQLADFYDSAARFSRSKDSHSLLKLAVGGEAGDTGRFLGKIDDLRLNYSAQRPMSLAYMKALRDKVRQRFPGKAWNDPEVVAAWEEGVAGAFGIKPTAGSVAEEAGQLLRGQQATVRDDLAKQLDDLPDGAGAEARELIESITTDPFALPMSLEVPAGGIARFGPRRAIRRAATTPLVQGTALGRRAAKLGVYHPPRWLNYHETPDRTAYEMARYFRMPERESRIWQSRVLEEVNKGPGFEDRIDDVIDELTTEGIRTIAAPYKIDPVFLDEFIAANLDPIREMRMKLKSFGVEEIGTDQGNVLTTVTRPLFESQRKNMAFLVDPVEVETRLQQVVGAPKRMEQAFRRALSKTGLADVPEIGLDFARLDSRVVRSQEFVRRLGRSYLRLWKAGTVARPAYISRVVLFDEQLRFLSTTGSLTERLLSQKGLGKLVNKTHLFDRSLDIGDDSIRLPKPHEPDYEPLAANSTRQAEVIGELARRADLDYSALTRGAGWDLVDPKKNAKLHLASWHRALVRDVANSPHGVLALEMVAAGKGLDDTTSALVAYAKTPANFARLQRGGIVSGVDDVDMWARQVSQTVHSYTLAGTKHQGRIAKAVLAQADGLEDVLKQVQRHAPPVHGPMTEDLMLGAAGTQMHTGVVDMAYSAFVRIPEDIVNRQPFYRVWKTRAEEAYLTSFAARVRSDPKLQRLQRTGIEAKMWPSGGRAEFTTSEQLEAAFRSKSDDYWYHQTKTDPADLKEGLTPRFRQDEQGNVIPWEGGGREARVYFAPAPEFSTYLTSLDAGPMLRVPRAAVPDAKQGIFGVGDAPVEFTSRKAVRAKDIEFFGTDGQWHSLRDAAKTYNKPLTSEVRRAIDLASRDFALAQVKKVMFDFTRQSRFTELLQMAVPFPQPFFEGFQAWGHLAVRNPGIIGRARTLFQAGKNSGAIFQDENGEWRVRQGAWAAVARKLKILDPDLAKSLSFTAPLTSFNMLSASSMRIPETGILGDFVGGVYVPVPSLHPPLMNVLQTWFADNPSESITGYLFQFGPGTPFIPNSVRRTVNAVTSRFGDPVLLSDDRLTAATGEIMKQYQAQPALIEGMSEEEVAARAREDAIDLLAAQDLVGLLSPGALQARFGHDEVEDEFNRRAEEDPTKAYEWLNKNHPDLSLIGMGKTIFTGSYKDAEGKPVRAPREISSEFFGRLVAQPGFREFARNHPEWVALLVVGIGEEAREFDFSTFSRQVRSGVLSYKRPEDYWAQGEDSKAWNKWYEWRRDQWVPAIDSLPEAVEEDDPAYTQLKARRRMALTHIAVEHPGWARRHLVENEDGTWDFGYDPSGGPASTIEVLADARAIVNTKGWDKHPGVRALGEYLGGRDGIEERMRNQGVRSVFDSEKLSSDYDKLKARVVQMVPEADQSTMETFLDSYFENDLKNIRGYQDRKMERFAPEVRDAVVKFDTRLEVLSAKAQTEYEHNWERSSRFQDMRDYTERVWKSNPGIVRRWWGLLKPGEQDEYKESLVTRPSVFWSSHDWEVMGLKLSKPAAKALNEMGQARIEIQKRENADPLYSESEGYEQIDVAIRAYRGKDKTFDAAVKAMSDWAYPLEAAGLHKRPVTGRVWKLVIAGAREVQRVADKLGWEGVDFGDEVDRKNYAMVQNEFTKWVKEWQREVPAFKEEWDVLKTALQGSVIEDLLIPDSYFGRLGTVG
jgi:hypothetical protein